MTEVDGHHTLQILVTVPSISQDFGGPSAKAFHLASAMNALGQRASVIGGGHLTTRCDVETIPLGQIGRFRATPVPRRVAALARFVKNSDVVHVLGYRDPVSTIALATARAGSQVAIFEPVGMMKPGVRTKLIKRVFDGIAKTTILARPDLVIATSRREAEEIRRAMRPIRPHIALRPNGIPELNAPQGSARQSIRSRFEIPFEAPLVLSFARFNHFKGLEYLAQAILRLPDFYCLLAGPDEGDGTLARIQTTARRADGRIKLAVGGLWEEDKAAALAEADLFCMPSRSESFGTAAAEAAAAGLPVVLTRTCGVRDWLHEDAIAVTDYGDVDNLCRTLRRASGDPNIRSSAQKSSTLVKSKLNWAQVAHQQLKIYRTLLSGDIDAQWSRNGR